MKTFLNITAILVLTASALAAPDPNVLKGAIDGQPAPEMMARYLDGVAAPLLQARRDAFEAVKSEADASAYIQQLKPKMDAQLGGFPERTPLNARTIGQGTGDGFRYEKMLFESRPALTVTAVLFLPVSDPPYPGVIVPCGHSENGKAYETYQKVCMLLARNGMAALIYDPIGQAERYYYLKDDNTPLFGSTIQHTVMGVGAILTGTNLAAYDIWDGMRAIDVLTERPDIDPAKIGCTGNSGGGTLTSYLMALDDRIVCAAPSCYLTTCERLLATIGPQDAEQNIFGQFVQGLNQTDYLLMHAPKPAIILSATRDFFDIQGTWDTFRQAKRFYGQFGVPERVDIMEADVEHSYGQAQREAMVRFMKRWYFGANEVITEPALTPIPDADLQCSPTGQVMRMENAVGVPELDMRRDEAFAPKREEFWRVTPRPQALEKVAACIGARPFEQIPDPQVKVLETTPGPAYTLLKLTIQIEPGIVLPALQFVPPQSNGTALLYCPGGGKAQEDLDNGPIPKHVAEGDTVLVVDLRGIGETESPGKYPDWVPYTGPDWQDYYRAYLVGKSYVGLRTEDIFALAKYVKTLGIPALALEATGEAAVPALHAAALAPDLFARIRLYGGIPSWSAVVHQPRAAQQLINAVHGALAFYDLTDLVNTLQGKLIIEQTQVPAF